MKNIEYHIYERKFGKSSHHCRLASVWNVTSVALDAILAVSPSVIYPASYTIFPQFLLLMHYVPNVAKEEYIRSVKKYEY